MIPLDEIAHLADVPVDVAVQLDSKVMNIREILELESGSVIKMTRPAGENIDILVAGVPVGFGEIVIIEDAVGVRITDFRDEN